MKPQATVYETKSTDMHNCNTESGSGHMVRLARPGHDMHAGLASLTIWPDPLSVLQLCISVDFVSYTVA